jgi:hopene-associated glycosyltransferase HpnB
MGMISLALDALEIGAWIGAILWIAIALLPWRPWSTRERLEAAKDFDPLTADLSDVTVLIPARDEADVIEATMQGLNQQGHGLSIILVDDQSTDGTEDKARAACTQNLRIVKGAPLPAGWAGKLWALEQGRNFSQTHYTLLMDADIRLQPGVIAALRDKAQQDSRDFVSLMAALRMNSHWEKLLIPSFIFFFKLLYPFALGNSRRFKMGVAAGGCIFLKTSLLEEIGGFASIRGALIDDCSLAHRVRSLGHSTYIGLTRSVISHRAYDDLSSIWNMVARSAFTQLYYSQALLYAVTIVMLSMFVALPLGLLIWGQPVMWAGVIVMIAVYIPTLRFYRQSWAWALLMPLMGVMYLMMTWTSALRYWRGKRSQWKGRVYSSDHQSAA